MSEFRRRMMMQGKQEGMVYIEYLASEQDAKIDTGIVGANSNLSFDIEVMAEPTVYPCWVFGSQASSRRSAFLVVNSSTKASLRVNANSTSLTNGQFPFSIGERHQIIANRTTTTIDGNSYSNNTGNASGGSRTIALFNQNTVSTNQAGKVTIYYFKIYNGESLVRDFVPVRVGQVGYMYDNVSGELFGNVGTGNFILGNDLNI